MTNGSSSERWRWLRRSRLGPGLSVAALLAAFAAWVVVPAGAADAPAGFIFVSGNVLGFLQECGCKRAPLGGLDKRSGYVEQVLSQASRSWKLWLDAGNFSDTPGAAGETKTRGLIEAMNMLGYRASGVGERDLMLGPEHLETISDVAEFPFLSANLVRRKQGGLWLPPYEVIEMEDGLRVGIVGTTRFNPMLQHRLPDGDTLTVRDPLRSLPDIVKQLEGRSDLVVLLALLPIEDARQIAREVPGIDIIVGGHGTTFTKSPVQEGGTLILYVGDEGKYLGQVAVYRSRDGRTSLRGELVSLYPSIPGDPLMEMHVRSVIAQAQESERLSQAVLDPLGDQPGAPQFLGSGSCTPCHSGLVAEWAASPHARAYETLVFEAGSARSACVGCHVTGYELPGGFVSLEATPHLKGVGCESCHGPAAAHVIQPDRPYGRVSLATCTSCHTAEQDSNFNYYESLPLVNHGAPLAR